MKRYVLAILAVALLAGQAAAATVCYGDRCEVEREGLGRSVVRVSYDGYYRGSGVVVKHDGHVFILSALHVVNSQTSVTLHAGTGRIDATVIGRSEPHDVAVMMAEGIETLDVEPVVLLTEAPPEGAALVQYGYGGGKLCRMTCRVLGCSNDRIAGDCHAIGGDSGGPVFVNGRLAGLVTHRTNVSTDGRLIFTRTKPAFIGTASLIVTAILNAKPIIEKAIELYKLWRKIRGVWRGNEDGTYSRPILSRIIRGKPQDEEPEPHPVPQSTDATPNPNLAKPWLHWSPNLTVVINKPPVVESQPTPDLVPTPADPVPEETVSEGVSPWWILAGAFSGVGGFVVTLLGIGGGVVTSLIRKGF